jgi:hypothetical protein
MVAIASDTHRVAVADGFPVATASGHQTESDKPDDQA